MDVPPYAPSSTHQFSSNYAQSISLSETIIHKPILIVEQTSLEQAAQLMMEKQQDRIFVVDSEEKLVGVASGIDIVKKIIEALSSPKFWSLKLSEALLTNRC